MPSLMLKDYQMKMKHLHNSEQEECRMIVRYLIRTEPTAQLCNAYHTALTKTQFEFGDDEKKIWLICMRHPWMLKYIDAYLAYKRPYHSVRQRIYLVLGLLETQPEYSKYFLPATSSLARLPVVFLRLINAYLKIIVGQMLVSKYE